MGDKDNKNIANLKFGELRYYTRDNNNLTRAIFFNCNKTFVALFKIIFPNYEVILDNKNIITNIIEPLKNNYDTVVKNNAYICIREATKTINGLVIGIHDGYSFICEERLINSNINEHQHKIKRVGHYYGDKSRQVDNLKFAEFRYYWSDNNNITNSIRLNDARDFEILLKINFPSYNTNINCINPNNIPNHFIHIINGGITPLTQNNKSNEDSMDNKGYLCIKEATKELCGISLGIHDNKGYILKEVIRDK